MHSDDRSASALRMHEVGLLKRLAIHTTGTRVASFAGKRTPASPPRECLRPVRAIDHTVCSRNGPSRASEHNVREPAVLALSNPPDTVNACTFPAAVPSAQQEIPAYFAIVQRSPT